MANKISIKQLSTTDTAAIPIIIPAAMTAAVKKENLDPIVAESFQTFSLINGQVYTFCYENASRLHYFFNPTAASLEEIFTDGDGPINPNFVAILGFTPSPDQEEDLFFDLT